MTCRVDVLVVGGGPAGATLACLAAEAGARTMVVERARFPRDKVCGEFVSAEGCRVLERLGVLPDLLSGGATWIESCRVTEPRGARLDLPLPHLGAHGREGLGVSRARMDTALLALAARRGAIVRQRWEAAAPLFRDGVVAGARLRRVGTDRTEDVEAAVIAAADGRRSLLARRLHGRGGDPSRSRPASWFGLQQHLEAGGAGPGQRVELHFFDNGYAGIGPVERGRVNVCLMTTVGVLRACGGSPARVLEERVRANPAARETLGEAVPSGRWRSVGPLRFGARRAAARGVVFVGDAAGTIDPFSGEGMSHALLGAELALPHVLRAASRGRLTEDLARDYQRTWSKAFGPVTRRVRLLGRLFERPRHVGPLVRWLAGAGRLAAPWLVATTRTGGGAGRPRLARRDAPVAR